MRVFAHGHQLADLRWRIGQAHAVLDVALVLADLLRELPHRIAEIHHLPEHGRLLERGDVLALQVLDDRDLERGLVVELGHDGGDRLALCQARGAPAPLAGDQLVLRAHRPHQDRLQHAVLPDGIGELGQRVLLVGEARLRRVGQDLVDRDLPDLGMDRLRFDERDDAGTQVDGLCLIEETMDVLAECRALASQVRSPRAPGRGTHVPRPSWWRTRSPACRSAAPPRASPSA